MDLLELIAGVQEDVENAPVETVRWEPPEHGTNMRELVFEFYRLTGLDIDLQTKILADTLSGFFEKAPSWCWDLYYKRASCALYIWLNKNGGTSLPNNKIVDKLIDCLRGSLRTSILKDVRIVLDAHFNHIRVTAMQMHADLTTAGFYKDAGEAMQMLQRNALSMVVRNYVVKRREEEERQNDIALMAT